MSLVGYLVNMLNYLDNKNKDASQGFTFGFTLIEVLLTVALLGVISGIGTPVYQSFQNRNDLNIAAQTVVQSARRAQLLSQSQSGDSSWGIYIATSTVTVFRGSSYDAREVSLDEDVLISSSIVISGTDEYIFSKLSGEPSSIGTTTLTSLNDEVRDVFINPKGAVTISTVEEESGGGGGGKIICTELHRQNLLSDEIYQADQEYGRLMAEKRPHLMRGYHLWAKPVVNIMERSQYFTTFVAFIAEPWAQQMAFEMGIVEKGSLVGKVMMYVGEPPTEAIGFIGNKVSYVLRIFA